MGIELNNDQIYAVYDLEHWWNKRDNQVFEISGAAGTGKAIPTDTIIPTPNGPTRFGDLKTGDYVFSRTGVPTKVLGVFDKGELEAYQLTFDDGRTAICCNEHIWSCYTSKGNLKNFTTQEMLDIGIIDEETSSYRFYIPVAKPVQYEEKKFEICPYIMGMMCGDGSQMQTEYFYGSIDQRVSFLQGLFYKSTDIMINDKCEMFYSNDRKEIMDTMRSILLSLGCMVTVNKNSLCIRMPNELRNKLFTSTHILSIDTNCDYTKTKIISIEKLGYKCEMRCIYVDAPDHLYLMNDYIVTHNTYLIRYFIDRIGLEYDNVLFLAFMGKAASVMARNGLPAKTIHSAIYDYAEKMARDDDGKIIIKPNGKPKLIPYFKLKDHISKKIKLIVVDEASMVSKEIGEDLLSFGIPVVTLGDLNQLPPVFGNPYFLKEPNVILHQIMRQAEGNPVIWLSQQVLAGKELRYGVYGNSAVVPRKDITEFHFKKSDIIITGTNRLRYNINNFCRTEIKGIKNLEYPHVGEKVICRKNNWNQCIGDNIYLTNGTTGFVDYIYRDSYNKKTMKMDFRPDFTKKTFKNVEFDYMHMYAIPGKEEETENPFGYYYDKMEYAYAITCHSSQGSAWENVLYLHEDFMRNPVDAKKLKYTAITRARESINIVI